MRIDLNADVGESWPRWESGEDVALLEVVSSANVCCGAYAGDEQLMQATCESAVAHGIAIGAQVGYPDREGFGRAAMTMPPAALRDEVVRQILLLTDIATSVGGTVAYVKPHGALYNAIVHDDIQAQAVVDAILGLARAVPLAGLPGSASLSIAAGSGVSIIREGFADRAYASEGWLVPREQPGAVLDDAAAVAGQAVRLLGHVDSICVHSDTPGALALARAVRAALEAAGAQVASL